MEKATFSEKCSFSENFCSLKKTPELVFSSRASHSCQCVEQHHTPADSVSKQGTDGKPGRHQQSTPGCWPLTKS